MSGAAIAPRPVQVIAFTLFYSHLRIELEADAAMFGTPLAALFSIAGKSVPGRLVSERRGAAIAVIVEALVDAPTIFTASWLELGFGTRRWRRPLAGLAAACQQREPPSLAGAFQEHIDAAAARLAPARPRLLDLGGRARSGIERRLDYPQCDVTVADIRADPSVDIVCDAHELDECFAPETFHFALCVSVFEHLLMPWKAVLGLGAVLKTGGYALIHTHQTIGLHDLPWDFYRYSDTAWQGLFNQPTGFQIVRTSMSDFMHVVPRCWSERHRGGERSGGFEGSSVIVRKVGDSHLRWDVRLDAITDSSYPAST